MRSASSSSASQERQAVAIGTAEVQLVSRMERVIAYPFALYVGAGGGTQVDVAQGVPWRVKERVVADVGAHDLQVVVGPASYGQRAVLVRSHFGRPAPLIGPHEFQAQGMAWSRRHAVSSQTACRATTGLGSSAVVAARPCP